MLLADEPAWPVLRPEIAGFPAADRVATPVSHLSDREREILLLRAEGLDNTVTAQRRTLRVRTVERQFQNVYLKFGLPGRIARAASVAQVLA